MKSKRVKQQQGFTIMQMVITIAIIGWLKTIALFRQTRHRGVRRVGWMFTFAAAVYNLIRIHNLIAEQAA